jgi:hypothetical protein
VELGSDEAEGSAFGQPHWACAMQHKARTRVAEKTRLKYWFVVAFGGTPCIDLYLRVSKVRLVIAEQMGLVGLGSCLLAIWVLFAYAWRAWPRMGRDSDLEPLLLGLAGALLSPPGSSWLQMMSSTKSPCSGFDGFTHRLYDCHELRAIMDPSRRPHRGIVPGRDIVQKGEVQWELQ